MQDSVHSCKCPLSLIKNNYTPVYQKNPLILSNFVIMTAVEFMFCMSCEKVHFLVSIKIRRSFNGILG